MSKQEMADLLRDVFNDYWIAVLNTPRLKVNWEVMESLAWRANQAEEEAVKEMKK